MLYHGRDFLQQSGHAIGMGISAHAGVHGLQTLLRLGRARQQYDAGTRPTLQHLLQRVGPLRIVRTEPDDALLWRLHTQPRQQVRGAKWLSVRKSLAPTRRHRGSRSNQTEMLHGHRSVSAFALARNTGLSRYDRMVFLPVRMSTWATIPGMTGRPGPRLDLRVRTRM